MMSQIYSAGLISQSFWFVEMKKFVRLVYDGKTEAEIKKLCVEENLFGVTNEYRAKRVFGYIRNRVKKLDKALIELFCNSDLATQKLINLTAIIKGDRLLFEFLFEVYREKVLLGVPVIEEADLNVFFKNKGMQDETVESWTEETKKRLKSVYINFITDANLITVSNKVKQITPPILDMEFERYLEANGDFAIIKAITGVN